MKPEYLNSLKAGIKTAVITFIVTLIAGLVTLMDALRSWTTSGNPPDMDALQKFGWAALLALLIGLGNTVVRFLQAAGVPLVSQILDKLIGVIPDYLPPQEGPVDAIGDPNPGLNRDQGSGDNTTILFIAAAIVIIVVGLVWLVRVL